MHACMQTYQQILVHTSLELDMVLQGLWVLRVRQHIKVARSIQEIYNGISTSVSQK